MGRKQTSIHMFLVTRKSSKKHFCPCTQFRQNISYGPNETKHSWAEKGRMGASGGKGEGLLFLMWVHLPVSPSVHTR